jgi:hypothetical protein
MGRTTLEAGVLRRWRPVLWAGALALVVGAAEAAPVSSRLVALRKATGAPLATVTLWRSAEGAGGKPIVSGPWAYFVEDGKALCGLSLVSGKIAWRAALPSSTPFAPILVGPLVVACTNDSLYAYRGTTGHLVWSFALQDLNMGWSLTEKTEFAVGSGRLFICAADMIVGLQADNGQPLWATRTRQAEHPRPVVSGRFLYVRTADPDEPWSRRLVADGTDARDEGIYGAMEADPERGAKPAPVTSALLTADGKSLTATVGKRRMTYRAPAPFTIAGVVGETPGVLCLQLVAESPLTGDVR